MTLSRRTLLIASPLIAWAAAAPARAASFTFYRGTGCECCHKWVQAMTDAGLQINLLDIADMAPVHARLNVPEALLGCHAGEIDGYAIEGHVPPLDILRLLHDRPAGRGLAVPGMPLGSPGMEMGAKEPYQVLLFQADGTTSMFAQYG